MCVPTTAAIVLQLILTYLYSSRCTPALLTYQLPATPARAQVNEGRMATDVAATWQYVAQMGAMGATALQTIAGSSWVAGWRVRSARKGG